MGIKTVSSRVAGASVPAPSAGDVLRFAAYVADLVGSDRVDSIAWHDDSSTGGMRLFVTVTDTTHGQTVAHLLGLDDRSDIASARDEGFSAWMGTSGNVPVFLSAPLALGGLPERRPYGWSETTSADDVRAVA